ncbi:uncharacterized protein [Nicotiana tomentosiformis]|uniref:uncharacterized protein n=1 Tax=Nicotiana tomentosiformis TaxID=4098 RepID=UPI00388C6F31
MSVMQYEMRFLELACHAIWLVPTDRERIMRFINGPTYQLRLLMTRKRVSGATFDEVVDIARQIEMFHHGRGRPFRHAQTARPGHRGASSGHGSHSYQQGHSSLGALPAQSSSRALSGQGSSMPGPSAGYPGARGSLQSPTPAPGCCYECGEFGHMRRECPHIVGGLALQTSQSMSSVSVPLPPAQSAKGGAQSARVVREGDADQGVARPVSKIFLLDQMLLL